MAFCKSKLHSGRLRDPARDHGEWGDEATPGVLGDEAGEGGRLQRHSTNNVCDAAFSGCETR
jgi:hypothetical protein